MLTPDEPASPLNETPTTAAITKVEIHTEDTTLPNTKIERASTLPPNEPASHPKETNASTLNEDESTEPQAPESYGDYWVTIPDTEHPNNQNGL